MGRRKLSVNESKSELITITFKTKSKAHTKDVKRIYII